MNKLRVVLYFVYNHQMNVTMDEIGMCLIAAVLREHGYEVKLMADFEEDVNYEEIIKFKPDVIGFPVYQLAKKSVYNVSQKIKSLLPDIKVCVGGVYTTYNAEKMLKENAKIDFGLRGEGEETFLELMDKLSAGEDYTQVKGITYWKDNEIVNNEDRPLMQDLDVLPFAARDIMLEKKWKVAVISGSRGCNSRCAFCATQLFWKKWRGRSVTSIVDELEMLVKEYGIRVFNFIDSSFEDPYIDLRRMKAIAQEIIRRDLKISYFADVRAEFHKKVTPEIMELLIQSGLTAVCIGIEAGNNTDLKVYHKIAKVEDNIEIINLLRKYKIRISPGFINFNPYSTVERLRENLMFLKEIGYPIKFFSKLAIFKGTTIYHDVKNDGLITNGDKEDFSYVFVNKEVQLLSDYLTKYRNEINTAHNYVHNTMDYYIDVYALVISHYGRMLKLTGNQKINDYFDKYIENYEEVISQFNAQCVTWCNVLLDIAERGWNEEKADKCTQELMPFSNFVESERKLSSLKDALYLNLYRNGYGEMLFIV
ncbi:B12-binding domain-containing radical SAM protein [Cellulosilyticum ruminicola]|uniref:B12-binding domain-containing radical SAM protein n=1 Tax=Cellulosilyticum ruminicola TaxID=425254 RepID=UPI0006D11918|nr:radical SAM protein [Cellulosilyticum ruminicola]